MDQNPVNPEESGADTTNPLQEEVEKYKNQYLYLRAEFENFKRQAIKERSELIRYEGERIILALLEIVDNFERALSYEVNSDNFKNFVSGVQLTAQELKLTLGRFGVTEVPSLGQTFDPSIHEALGQEPSTSHPPGHISRILKKPYRLHDKLIRTGQVIVSKENTPDENARNPGSESPSNRSDREQ